MSIATKPRWTIHLVTVLCPCIKLFRLLTTHFVTFVYYMTFMINMYKCIVKPCWTEYQMHRRVKVKVVNEEECRIVSHLPLNWHKSYRRGNIIVFFGVFFCVRLLSVLHGHSFFSSPPQRPMTSDFEGFSIPDFMHYIYFLILNLEKEPVFYLLNIQC